jgi:hypothetical protein
MGSGAGAQARNRLGWVAHRDRDTGEQRVCGSIPMAAVYPTSESPLRLRKTGLEKWCRSSERL